MNDTVRVTRTVHEQLITDHVRFNSGIDSAGLKPPSRELAHSTAIPSYSIESDLNGGIKWCMMSKVQHGISSITTGRRTKYENRDARSQSETPKEDGDQETQDGTWRPRSLDHVSHDPPIWGPPSRTAEDEVLAQ